MDKPPLGIQPRSSYEEYQNKNRMVGLADAIKRHTDAYYFEAILLKWIDELKDRVIREIERPKKEG